MKIFGIPAYAHLNDNKFEPITKRKCIFLGHTSRLKEYRLRCLVPKALKSSISRDVTFDESGMLLERCK